MVSFNQVESTKGDHKTEVVDTPALNSSKVPLAAVPLFSLTLPPPFLKSI